MIATGEQLTLPGVPVPPQEAWREHTAERWMRDDPESYRECCEAVKRGELNKTRLADRFGKSRNSVQALMMREFSVEQLRDITTKTAIIVTGEAMSKTDELIPAARVKELGAVAMAGQIAFGIAQLGSGGPTEIVEKRTVLTVDDFTDYLAALPEATLPGTGLEAGKVSAIGAGLAGPVIEVETVGLGGKPPLGKECLFVEAQEVVRGLILLFIPVWQIGAALVTWAFNRGGGG